MKKSKPLGLLLMAMIAAVIFSCEVKTYEHGEILYKNFCANCHMEDGTGLEGVIPPLAGADFLGTHSGQVPCIIRKGIKGPLVVNGREYNTEMAGIPQLTEFEVTNVINYINTAWGNDFEIVKHLEVREALENCE